MRSALITRKAYYSAQTSVHHRPTKVGGQTLEEKNKDKTIKEDNEKPNEQEKKVCEVCGHKWGYCLRKYNPGDAIYNRDTGVCTRWASDMRQFDE